MKLGIVIGGLVLAACSQSKVEDDKALAASFSEAKAVEMYGKIADMYEAAGPDCAKLVLSLEAFIRENKDALRAKNAWMAALTPEQRASLDEKFAGLQIGKKMGPTLAACADDASLATTLKKLD